MGHAGKRIDSSSPDPIPRSGSARVFGRWSQVASAVSPSAVMLRILLVVLACSNALAVTPSSTPVMQPLSMQKRLQTLLHCPSRSALADVLHGPYLPDAPPAYLRAVWVLIVASICWLHIAYMCLPLWIGQPITSCLKDLTTRCSMHFCKMRSFNCEFACGMFGTAMPAGFIMGAIIATIVGFVYVPAILFIVCS